MSPDAALRLARRANRGVERGSVVIATAHGFGTKLRPWVVMQAGEYLAIGTLILIPSTSDASDPPSLVRPSIAPSSDNGLQEVSEAMVNLPLAIRSEKIHQHSALSPRATSPGSSRHSYKSWGSKVDPPDPAPARDAIITLAPQGASAAWREVVETANTPLQLRLARSAPKPPYPLPFQG